MVEEKKEEVKDLYCQICEEITEPCDFNAYFGACNKCVDKSGRL